jgi:hypothetical protein
VNQFSPRFLVARPDTGEQLRRYRDRFIHEKNEVIDVKWWPDKEKTGALLRNLDRYRARHLFFAGLEQKPKVSLKGEEGF